MARPRRCRRICAEPDYNDFGPTGIAADEKVVMTVDEYEVIRLIDLEKLTQEQCAAQIGVARTTVTDIYDTARSKLADCLVSGKQLTIFGGSYVLCTGNDACFCRGNCDKMNHTKTELPAVPKKGEETVRIAVTYENETVFQHFGRTEYFKLYDVENGVIIATQLIDTNGQGHGALGAFLHAMGVDTLICGGIGGGAQAALAKLGIRLYGGVSGSCDQAVNNLLAGTLVYSADAACSHHEHTEGGCHPCGEHDRNS